VYGKTIQNGKKDTLRMYGTVIDITEQKMVLEDLKESEATFRLLADSMPQFVWMGDINGNLNYFNRAVYEYSGLTPEMIEEQGWIIIVHPDDRDENINKWMHSINTGEEFIFEHRFKNSKGEYRWQLSRALPQKDQQGIIQRWVGTSTDIQDQKNLSQQLEHQILERTLELSKLNESLLIRNNIFSQAEENALIGSYSWNLQTGELEYSDNLFRLFGFEPNEFKPSFEKYHSLIHPDDKEQVMRDGMETMRTKKLNANIYRIITKNGKIKHFRSTGKFFGEENNVMLIGTVQDISQDIMMNEILRIKNLQLERSNAELESFNYIASHDLQEPLRKIQAFSQRILQKEGHLFSAFSQDYFSRINASAARMQNLINALLSYSRADASAKEAKTVDLNIIMEQVIADLQEMIEEKKAHFIFNPLPTIHGVNIQVQQLMINLVSNAIKYSKPGVPPVIRITVAVITGNAIPDPSADKKLNYWKIDVADNGIGFEQEYEHKIFELFQRLHNNQDYMGTGIGLAICKKIIRNHQGFITATGQPGLGAVFSIYFPFSK
jgi:PAS domain S-box-containing protein